jgi:hypothetical protein
MQQVVVETAGWVRADAEADTVEVTLTYDPADPFAVTVHASAAEAVEGAGGAEGAERTGAGRDLHWVFGRDLLADGLRSMVPVGEGRIQVQATSVLTEISHLDEHGEFLVLRVPWWNTREFIRLSQVEVPRGHESCDVDSWVAQLTTREP